MSSTEGAGHRGRILIVDDEPRVARSITRLLASDHEVTGAEGAREALAMIGRGGRYDVILCDLMMLGMSGMDLHVELERTAPEQAARMVFMTGGAYTDAAQQFLERVPNRRLDKPFRPEALCALVAEMVR